MGLVDILLLNNKFSIQFKHITRINAHSKALRLTCYVAFQPPDIELMTV